MRFSEEHHTQPGGIPASEGVRVNCSRQIYLYLSMMRLALLRGSSPPLPPDPPPPPPLPPDSFTHKNAAPPTMARKKKVEKICAGHDTKIMQGLKPMQRVPPPYGDGHVDPMALEWRLKQAS